MARLSRRDVLKVGIGGTAALALGAGPAWGKTLLKPTQVTAVLYAAHLVAEAGGHFKKEGVDVELVTSPAGARSAQMLAAGEVHYVLGDSSHGDASAGACGAWRYRAERRRSRVGRHRTARQALGGGPSAGARSPPCWRELARRLLEPPGTVPRPSCRCAGGSLPSLVSSRHAKLGLQRAASPRPSAPTLCLAPWRRQQ